MKRALYGASTTPCSLAAEARRNGCLGEPWLVSKWGYRTAVARVLVVGLLAGALFVTTPEGVQPAGASVSGPIMGIGAVCDGSGQMSGFWAWGMPIQSPPVTQADGALLYRVPGAIDGKDGFFEIAINPNAGAIFHRTFVGG